jgi:hypothetical protein
LRDDERAEGSVDVELGFFIFHGYRIAQARKNAMIFLRLKKLFFVLDMARWHDICVAYCVSA